MPAKINSGILGFLRRDPDDRPVNLWMLRKSAKKSKILLQKVKRLDMSQVDSEKVLVELLSTLIQQVGLCEAEAARANDISNQIANNDQACVDHNNLIQRTFEARFDKSDERMDNIDKAIKPLERFQARIQGQTALIAALAAAVPTVVGLFLQIMLQR